MQVQSNGYTGNGFLSASPGQPSQATLNAVIQPIAAPLPQIMFQNVNVSGTTQDVVAGQQIALTISTSNLSAGVTLQSQSWSFSNPSAATGGFVNTTGNGPPSANGGGKEAPLPPLTQGSLTFYWKVINDTEEAIAYTYTLNNGMSNSASVVFNIGGPTGEFDVNGEYAYGWIRSSGAPGSQARDD